MNSFILESCESWKVKNAKTLKWGFHEIYNKEASRIEFILFRSIHNWVYIVQKHSKLSLYCSGASRIKFILFRSIQNWVYIVQEHPELSLYCSGAFRIEFILFRSIQNWVYIVQEHPELAKDHFWDEKIPHYLPYTAAAEQFRLI